MKLPVSSFTNGIFLNNALKSSALDPLLLRLGDICNFNIHGLALICDARRASKSCTHFIKALPLFVVFGPGVNRSKIILLFCFNLVVYASCNVTW